MPRPVQVDLATMEKLKAALMLMTADQLQQFCDATLTSLTVALGVFEARFPEQSLAYEQSLKDAEDGKMNVVGSIIKES